MGEVWEAEQTEPVKRRVAVKLIKRGMDSSQVIARFESERQALALMDHSAIAKVFDAGTTERGRPYFVMELVHGVPITQYCDQHRMTVPERLELFGHACEGIQHAHQRAIIHRDVKPSNILVTEQDGSPVPKIIDFGVAKATAQRLTERTLFTELGQLVGTPEYMSPEQADLTGEDIDIRTDVYSLGMVLYELLVGAPPFDPKELRQAGLAELQRKIREDEPTKPSSQLTRVGDASTLVAKNRRTSVPSLLRSLRGDLDWIVMKALEKDRVRRYQTAHALAQDIERSLRSQTIVARPPSVSYRATRFVRRHRLGVAAATFVLLALVVGLLLATVGMVQAKRAETQARIETETSEQVLSFLLDLFEVSDPSESRGNTVTARELLDKGAQRIQEDLGDQPLIQARLMNAIGLVYRSLGLNQEARPLLEKALDLRRKILGDQHLDVAESMRDLGGVLWKTDDFDGAREHWRGALEIQQRELGSQDVEVARTLYYLAILDWQSGDSQQALAQLRLATQAYEGASEAGNVSAETAAGFLSKTLDFEALLAQSLGDFEAARSAAERALMVCEESYPADHPVVMVSVSRLGRLLREIGDYDGARPLLERLVEVTETVYGPDHVELSQAMNALAWLHLDNGDFKNARELLERTLSIREQALGPDHHRVAYPLNSLGLVLGWQGDYQTARSYLERALEISESALGPDHPDTGYCMTNLGEVLVELGLYADAQPLHEQALTLHEKSFGPDHPELAFALDGMGGWCEATGDLDCALEHFERALSIREAALPADHPYTAFSANRLAEALRKSGELERASDLYQRALQIREARFGPYGAYLASTLDGLAAIQLEHHDYSGAIALLERSIAIREATFGPTHPRLANSLVLLGQALFELGEVDPAFMAIRRAQDIQESRLGRDHLRTRETQRLYGVLLQEGGTESLE